MATKRKKGPNEIEQAVVWLNGFEATGRVCGVSGKAVKKWVKNGRLPRTEATGETNYAELLSKADPRIDQEKLLATVMKKATAAMVSERARA